MSARRLVVACYGASGAAALIYQVASVRMFTLAFGHTTASSSIVLGAFTLMRRFPAREDSRFYQATALFLENRHDEAERAIGLLVDAHPRHARALNMRGIICAAKRDQACAIMAFEESLKLDPRDSAVYVNLGKVYLERGDVEAAAELFRDAVALDPGADAARTALRTMSP